MQHVRHACLVLNCVYCLRFRLHHLLLFYLRAPVGWEHMPCGSSRQQLLWSRALSHISSVRKGWGQGEIGGPCGLAWKPNQETIPRVQKVITCQQLLHVGCVSCSREMKKIKPCFFGLRKSQWKIFTVALALPLNANSKERFYLLIFS